VAEVEQIAQEDGWKGFFLPAPLYDFLALITAITPMFGVAILGIAAVLEMQGGMETMTICGVIYTFLKGLLRLFKINYDKANKV
jgi:hypothetical protein